MRKAKAGQAGQAALEYAVICGVLVLTMVLLLQGFGIDVVQSIQTGVGGLSGS